MNEFQENLSLDILDARVEAKESHKMAMNSYGAGYDAGYLEGLKHALDMYVELEE